MRKNLIEGVILAGIGVTLIGYSQHDSVNPPISPMFEPPPAVLIPPDIPILKPEIAYDVHSPIGYYEENFSVPEESKKCFRWPVNGTISQFFGPHTEMFPPFNGIEYGHYAIDIEPLRGIGESIVSPADATVVFAGEGKNDKWFFGNYIVLDFGNGWKSLLAHNQDLLVSEGEKVYKGEVIATVGITGNSTGPHSHFELSFNGFLVDPLLYLESTPGKC